MSDGSVLHRRYRVGRWTVHELQAGALRLDGGAMFGVVPKVLWERRLAPDARNRIPMCMRCLLIEHDIGPVLVDCGAGSKEDAKFYDIYAVERGGELGRTRLDDALGAAGFAADQIALVVNTHLHFDHAGGNTVRDNDGAVRLAFPNARYLVQAGEYAYATHANERTAPSYFPHNFVPVHEAGRFDFVNGEHEIARGLRVLPTPGHTPHHQSVLLSDGGESLCFLADLVPTQWHVPLPWIMGYDVEPLVTLESKRALLGRAADEGWRVVLEHDAHVASGRIERDGAAVAFVPEAAADHGEAAEVGSR